MKDKCSRLRQSLSKSKAKINTLNTETETKEDNRMSIFKEKSSEELKMFPTQREHKERDMLKEKTHKY